MCPTRIATIELGVSWQGPHACHMDRLHVPKVDLWTDPVPSILANRLSEIQAGESIAETLEPGKIVPEHDPGLVRIIQRHQIQRHAFGSGIEIVPRAGRFYPRAILQGVPEASPKDRRPFRYLGQKESTAEVDLNHPLATVSLGIEARILAWLEDHEKHDEAGNDILSKATARGPGLQSAYPGLETDFFSGTPFARADDSEDTNFYQVARLVNHLDTVAMANVRDLYRRLLRPGMNVLDLMSSWNSHLPEELTELTVSGLGMNLEELAKNEKLSDYVMHDLNARPELPYEPESFDAAICTVSVEYLTHPIEVFRDLARTLKKGAPFVVTFSERWFPPKVITLWTELHPFERMGLVIDYFRRSGAFEGIATESIRGMPRPGDDKYFDRIPYSDPVYAVWGYRT